MIFYCNGDSFTSGHGLGDFILPGYPGPVDGNPYTDLRCSNWVRESYASSLRVKYQVDLTREELARAWPAKLGQLGHHVINAGQAGSSMDRVARTTLTDLIKMRPLHRDICVIICLPTHLRTEIYCDNIWYSINPAQPGGRPAAADDYCKMLIEHNTEYNMKVKWTLCIIQIIDHCYRNGINLLWIDSNNGYHSPVGDHIIPADLESLTEYAAIDFVTRMFDLAATIRQPQVPDGHYSEEIHALTAAALNNYITQGTQWRKF